MVLPSELMGRTAMRDIRIEHDLLGDREVPGESYWGVHTGRALDNFPISGRPLSDLPSLVFGLISVKLAAARANMELNILDLAVGGAIVEACERILAGAHLKEFRVDLIQGGAGTSSNMNANEVVANLALEVLGQPKGAYGIVHPLEHVNLSQSTNDVYPTAVKIAVILEAEALRRQMKLLRDEFGAKAAEFAHVLKMGRTQLQDAVPMTLGQEFSTYAVMLDEDIDRLAEAATLLHEINLGATAIGTGLNAPDGYAALACRRLSEATGLPVTTAENLVEATQDVGAFVQFSGVLKRISVKLSKVCNDLRLLSSGPRSGLHEINLPAVQAGSSIMPGKVNPVIPEVVNQVAFDVIGQDVTISLAAEAGQLQLNAFEPIIARSLLTSLKHLSAACKTLRTHCVVGITANETELADAVARSIGLVTALNPRLGYEVSTSVARDALATGRGVVEIVLERGLLTAEELADLLSPQRLANIVLEPTNPTTQELGAAS